MDKLRIGVVGLKFGQYHVRTLANMDDVQLVAVADSSPDVPGGLDAYAARFGAQAYTDGLEMMERERLDAVSLCVSPRYREALIENAIQRNIALFIEKPFATNVAHAQHLAALCNRSTATVMVAFSFRFHPAIVRLRELLDGELGQGWLLNGEYVFSWAPPATSWLWDPQNGNGFINENSCHLFDAVNYLLGQPVSVMAAGGLFTGSPGEDSAAITLRYAQGGLAALTVGGIGARAYRDFPRIDLVTANGQARLRGRDHIWEALSWTLRSNTDVRSFLYPPETEGRTRYTYAFRHFFDCIRTGQTPSVGVADGVRTVAMAMAVVESARNGSVIQLGA
jgi:predicted dehydrogenase